MPHNASNFTCMLFNVCPSLVVSFLVSGHGEIHDDSGRNTGNSTDRQKKHNTK